VEICEKMVVECEGKREGCSHRQERQMVRIHEEICIFAKHVRLLETFKGVKDRYECHIKSQSEAELWRNKVMDQLETTFTMSKSIERYEAPLSGKYRLTVAGADGTNSKKHPKSKGGKGAEIQATFLLNKFDRLDLIVGENTSDGFGGGGSFVFLVIPKGNLKELIPMVISGGGGAAFKNQGKDAALEEYAKIMKDSTNVKKNENPVVKKDGEDGCGVGGGLGWKSVVQLKESKSFGGGKIGGGGFSGGVAKKSYGGGGGSFVKSDAEDVVKKLKDIEGNGFIKLQFVSVN